MAGSFDFQFASSLEIGKSSFSPEGSREVNIGSRSMPNSDRYRLGPFIFDQSTGKIWQGQKEDRPTPSERLILKLLIDNPEGLLPDNLKKAVLESTRVNL